MVALQFETGKAPALGPALQRHNLVRHPGVDQRLRADDAARPPGAGDDDQRIRVGHQIGETIDQFGTGAGLRAGDVEAVELVDRAAVEHDMLGAVAAQRIKLGGGDVRRVAADLDDLGEGLARHVAAGEQRVARHRPRRDAAGQPVDGVVAETIEPLRRPAGDAVIAVDEDDPRRFARHQPRHVELQPAIGQADREQRVAVAMRPLLAQVEKGNLLAVAEPASRGRDIDLLDFGHAALPKPKVRACAQLCRGDRRQRTTPATAGGRSSASRRADRWVPAPGRDGCELQRRALATGEFCAYSFSSRLALPLRIFSLSAAETGRRSAHSVPGGLSTNG